MRPRFGMTLQSSPKIQPCDGSVSELTVSSDAIPACSAADRRTGLADAVAAGRCLEEFKCFIRSPRRSGGSVAPFVRPRGHSSLAPACRTDAREPGGGALRVV